jgi:hypothetical protein
MDAFNLCSDVSKGSIKIHIVDDKVLDRGLGGSHKFRLEKGDGFGMEIDGRVLL